MDYIDFNSKRISRLSLGTVQFGLNYGVSNTNGQPKQKEVNKIIDFVTKEGLNCFDTAQGYGESEKVLGIALRDHYNTYIVSKLKSEAFLENPHDNLTKSLVNLQKNKLFALLLHDAQLLYSWNMSYSKIVHNFKKKQIDYFGVSIYTEKEFELAVNNDDIDVIQIPFNIFDQRAIYLCWFEKAKNKNKLLFIRSIYLQGLLLMKSIDIPQKLYHAKSYLETLEDFCQRLKISQLEIALSYVKSVSENAVILFGCETLEQAQENLHLYTSLTQLPKQHITEIQEKFSDIDESIYNPSLW